MFNKPRRGFQFLVGEKITKIDAMAINNIIIETESGKFFEIINDERLILGSESLAIIECKELPESYTK